MSGTLKRDFEARPVSNRGPTPQLGLPLYGRSPLRRLPPASKGATDTSLAAGESIGALAGALMGQIRDAQKRRASSGVALAIAVLQEVLAWLDSHSEGATADDIAVALRRNPLTVRPRLSELRRRGLVKDSGRRGRNASGKSAIIWVRG